MRKKWLYRGGLPEPMLRGPHRLPRGKAAPLGHRPTMAGDQLLWPTVCCRKSLCKAFLPRSHEDCALGAFRRPFAFAITFAAPLIIGI